MRAGFSLGILLTATLARPLAPQDRPPSLGEILRAEDHRASTAGELGLLFRGLGSADTLVLERALVALGRLERPGLAERILPLLGHALPGVRARAAQAVAQAVQGFRRDTSGTPRGSVWPLALSGLGSRVSLERDPVVRGILALSLGRLPYTTAEELLQAQERLVMLIEGSTAAGTSEVARGLESFARLNARRLTLSEVYLAPLRALARSEQADPRARRSALGAVLAGPSLDLPTLVAAAGAPDPLLRRLALIGAARLSNLAARDRMLQAGLSDSVALVRVEALRLWARVVPEQACTTLLAAVRDSLAAPALVALDLMGTACAGDPQAAQTLAAALAPASPRWHAGAHALVSLARVAPRRAAEALPVALTSPVWQVRMYAARAALALRDSSTLQQLAHDPVANVREAALAGLHEVSGHAADSLYRAALAAADYQLVLTAANALAGSPARSEGGRALLRAFERISRERRETSRDPRVAILVRLRELGDPALAPRLRRYLRDFDSLVADSAAALLSAWTTRTERASPRPLVPVTVTARELERLRDKRLRFSMASGGVFEVALLVDDAPLTVLRVARLAARGYYDGLSFHRMVPNFVIQGGSPGANEYAGQAQFMRDELGSLSHERGTLGISTRGRDTGDGQLFVNLVDNPRLDYEYTVWGRVVQGMAFVDAILEGDVIRRVELRSRPGSR
jgi:cyclophilin family peptidyl-prolyl cis-trans isomerase/HEAT repeat protein